MKTSRPRLTEKQVNTLIDALCLAANECWRYCDDAEKSGDHAMAAAFQRECYDYERLLEKLGSM